MAEIQRICPQCGKTGPIAARHCPHCGHDSEGALPVPRNNLPVVIGRTALPILAGVATLALRAGWKLLQSRTAQQAARNAVTALARSVSSTPPATQTTPPTPAQPSGRRTIRIRSSWAVGDASGHWQQGASDHSIEIDE